jgi:N utilization substance protein B
MLVRLSGMLLRSIFLKGESRIKGWGFQLNRSQARELALRVLFEVDVGKSDLNKVLQRALEQFPPQSSVDFARDLVGHVAANKQEIDRTIESHSIDWKVERMGNIDRNILRIAIAEMLYFDSIPINVSINEAVNLSKLYGDSSSYRFINGVLGAVSKQYAK